MEQGFFWPDTDEKEQLHDENVSLVTHTSCLNTAVKNLEKKMPKKAKSLHTILMNTALFLSKKKKNLYLTVKDKVQ